MATSKRVFTLRLSEDVLDKIGKLATKEHRSVIVILQMVQRIQAGCRPCHIVSFQSSLHVEEILIEIVPLLESKLLAENTW